MNKEFIRMQKLAGLMTEGLYTSDEKAPMEAMSHDGESKMTKGQLKKKIKEMMAPMPSEGVGMTGRGRLYYHVLEDGGYGRIGHQGVYNTKEEAQSRADELADMFPNSYFYVEAYSSKKEPPTVTMEESTIGQEAEAEMGSMDEYDTQGLTNAASVVDHYLKTAYDAGSTGVGFDDSLAYEMMDHLKQFSGEMGGMNEADSDHTMAAYRIAREMVRRMDFPDAMFGSKDLFLATIKALQDELYSYAEDQFSDAGSAPDEDDNYDDSRDVYDDEYPEMAEGDLFEAKEDEESDTEDVIVAEPGDEEVPAEDAAVDVTADDTQVDVNMDGVPDVDTGSAESKKAFTSLVDTYNSAKELGDPKLTQMIANALTYYNKNIILKSGQP